MDILALLGILAAVIAVNNFAKLHAWPVPAPILTMAVSMGIGAAAVLTPEFTEGTFKKLDEFAAMQFLTVWLAPIIFAEGYAMKTREFFDNISRILAHAFLGTTISTVVVALVVYHLAPLLGVSSAQELSFTECLAFGALISATDPVTTLAIFKEKRLAETGLGTLYYTVLGESVLNDAVGIALFTSFSKLVRRDVHIVDGANALAMLTEFSCTFVGSMFIGGVGGLFMPFVMKHAPLRGEAARQPEAADEAQEALDAAGADEGEEEIHFNVPEIGVALVLSLLPYLVAEACDLSGIVAIMFSGMVARYYTHNNLTRETRLVFLPMVELIAQLCETYVFILLGLGVFLFRNHYSVPLICAAVVGCLLGRAAHVYPLSAVVNRLSVSEKLPMNEQHMVCFAGLRGAIAFICAFSFPETGKSQHRYTIMCTTIAIVGASLVFFGWTTVPVMRMLDIRAPEEEEEHNMAPAKHQHMRTGSWSFMRLPISSVEEDMPPVLPRHRRTLSVPAHTQQAAGLPRTLGEHQGPARMDSMKRLDSVMKRFLMTKSAIAETNMTHFLSPPKKGRSPQKARAVGTDGPPEAPPLRPPQRNRTVSTDSACLEAPLLRSPPKARGAGAGGASLDAPLLKHEATSPARGGC